MIPVWRALWLGLGITPCCSPVAHPTPQGAERPVTPPPSSTRAVEPPPKLSFRQVVLGASHACALGEDGAVWCWGHSSVGVSDECEPHCERPARIPQLTGVIQLSASWNDTAALLGDGSIWTWSSKGSAAPRKQDGVPAARLAESGHGCVIGRDQKLWCAGWNAGGRLGLGSPDGVGGERAPRAVEAPRAVPLPAAPHQVVVGDTSGCALLVDGRVMCWGTRFRCAGPMQVQANAGEAVTALFGAHDHYCVLGAAGVARCLGPWGVTLAQQGDELCKTAESVGDGPWDVVGPASTLAATVTVAEQAAIWCAGRPGRGADCTFAPTTLPFGRRDIGGARVAIESPHHFTQLALTDSAACALTEDRRVVCWGSNEKGLLGDGSPPKTVRLTPTEPTWPR